MTHNYIEQSSTALTNEEIDLHIVNYPTGSEEGDVRMVTFGGDSNKVTILVEIDLEPEFPVVEVTVGNGPPNSDLAESVPEALYWVGDAIANAAETDEFQAALSNRQ